MSNENNISIIKTESAKLVANKSVERRISCRRKNLFPFALPASLMTHMIYNHSESNDSPQLYRPAINEPIDIYKRGANIAQKRVPAGWQNSQSV